MAAIFLLWWALKSPSNSSLIVVFVGAALIASYYAWRAEHMHLIPKFYVPSVIEYQRTPTANPVTGKKWTELWVQICPKCLTDASVEQCSGHLRRVLRWNEDLKRWEETQMNETLPLGWSHASGSITLEAKNEVRLNLFHVEDTRNIILPCTIPLPYLWEQYVYRPEDRYLFDITIRGRDCAPVDVYVKVKKGIEWDRPTVEIVSRPDGLS